MTTILEQLVKNFYDSLYGEKLGKEVRFHGGSIWIDSYDENDNTFSVAIDHHNMTETPNVEEYLEEALAQHIDIADAIYEQERVDEETARAEFETQRSICETYGWNF